MGLASKFTFLGTLTVMYFMVSGDDVLCGKNDHYTDVDFTCCASVKYEVPSLYSKSNLNECLTKPKGNDKIVHTSWFAFKCLVDKALGGKDLNYENFVSLMAAKFPQKVQTSINKFLQETFTEGTYDPYKGNANLKEFKTYATIWNAYYSAEHAACVEAGMKKDQLHPTEGRCFDWEERTKRRGGCCMESPIPFPIYTDPIQLSPEVRTVAELRKYTATTIMTIPGADYKHDNDTVVMKSKEVSMCKGLAKFVLRGLENLDDLKAMFQRQAGPNYDTVADKIIPNYVSEGIRRYMIHTMRNGIDNDHVIGMMRDHHIYTTIYNYTKADEWKSRKIADNTTRALLWSCQTYNILIKNYKQLDFTQMCY